MKSHQELRRDDEARQPATSNASSRPTSPDSANAQEPGSRPTSPDRPTSPKPAPLPEPARGSRFTLKISNIPFFTPKPSGGMHHSVSMPNLGTDEITSPKSPSSPHPLSAGRLRKSGSSRSPDSSSSPSSRHSVHASPRSSSQENTEDTARSYLQSSIEDAIQNALSDDYYLAEFSTSFSEMPFNPGHLFHCVIASTNNSVVFKKTYTQFMLNSIDTFVETFNRDCPYVKLTTEAITRGLDQNNFILSSYNLVFGNAVFVTGESKALGNWTTCYRLNFNKTLKAWRFTLPPDIDDERYKFKFGPHAEGKTASSDKLTWENYEGNRLLLAPQMKASAKKLGM